VTWPAGIDAERVPRELSDDRHARTAGNGEQADES